MQCQAQFDKRPKELTDVDLNTLKIQFYALSINDFYIHLFLRSTTPGNTPAAFPGDNSVIYVKDSYLISSIFFVWTKLPDAIR